MSFFVAIENFFAKLFERTFDNYAADLADEIGESPDRIRFN